MKRLGLVVTALFAIAVPSAAASPGYTIAGLKIQGVGAFGAVPVGSCNLLTYSGCPLRTFTVKNVGTTTIRIGGFAIADVDPLTAALGPSAPGSGCDFLPVVDGYWALSPDVSCRITVTFSPIEKGPVRNELHIWYLDQSQPIAIVPLSAVGT